MNPVFPNAAIVSPELTAPATPATAATPLVLADGPQFADVLSETASVPHFSRHALDRIHRRGIELSQKTLRRLGDGISRAAGKGSRNAVVFVDNTAFVANVPSHTVITAVGSEHMREHVFTNIDSAVIA